MRSGHCTRPAGGGPSRGGITRASCWPSSSFGGQLCSGHVDARSGLPRSPPAPSACGRSRRCSCDSGRPPRPAGRASPACPHPPGAGCAPGAPSNCDRTACRPLPDRDGVPPRSVGQCTSSAGLPLLSRRARLLETHCSNHVFDDGRSVWRSRDGLGASTGVGNGLRQPHWTGSHSTGSQGCSPTLPAPLLIHKIASDGTLRTLFTRTRTELLVGLEYPVSDGPACHCTNPDHNNCRDSESSSSDRESGTSDRRYSATSQDGSSARAGYDSFSLLVTVTRHIVSLAHKPAARLPEVAEFRSRGLGN